MLKIGFIDYFLDEWHANNYPQLIDRISGGTAKVCYAYGHTDVPTTTVTNAQWAKNFGVELVSTMEELTEKSDCIVVLSPDNPEMHEILCKIPLSSGKRVYVDKTFAPDSPTARRIFEVAEAHDTPCYSSSALRFAAELENIDSAAIDKIYSEGPNSLEIYSIHQIEMIVRLMDTPAKKVMFTGNRNHPSYIIEFADGRQAECCHRNDPDYTFALTLVDKENNANRVVIQSDYFDRFLKSMVRFFQTGEVPVSHAQTMDVISIRTAVIRAADTPYVWLDL